MSVKGILEDSENGCSAKVTTRGQLITAPLDFSKFYAGAVTANNGVANLLPPIANKRFVITSIILTSNKNLAANDATVTIYEAPGVSSTTQSAVIITLQIPKNQTLPLTGLNSIITNEGVWLNATSDLETIFFNVAGYYISA